jgi:hypothetical protein
VKLGTHSLVPRSRKQGQFCPFVCFYLFVSIVFFVFAGRICTCTWTDWSHYQHCVRRKNHPQKPDHKKTSYAKGKETDMRIDLITIRDENRLNNHIVLTWWWPLEAETSCDAITLATPIKTDSCDSGYICRRVSHVYYQRPLSVLVICRSFVICMLAVNTYISLTRKERRGSRSFVQVGETLCHYFIHFGAIVYLLTYWLSSLKANYKVSTSKERNTINTCTRTTTEQGNLYRLDSTHSVDAMLPTMMGW